jgi:hypothetical protein
MRGWTSYADGTRNTVAAVRGSRICFSREGNILLLVDCTHDWVALLSEAFGHGIQSIRIVYVTGIYIHRWEVIVSDISAIALCPLPGEYYAQTLAEKWLAVSVALATSMHLGKSLY